MPVLVGLLAGAAVAAAVAALATRLESNVAALFVTPQRRAGGLATKIGHRLLSAKIVRKLARTDRLSATIAAAGKELDLGDVMVVKCAAAATAAVTGLIVAPALAPLAPILAAGVFVVPDVVLSRAAARRRRAADLEVTQFLDLLAAASSAGLSAPAAIRRASTGVRGPLAIELEGASASVEVGGRWREELSAIASRLDLADLEAAVVVIARTETLGSSLAESLRDLAADVRGSRRARAAERARTAPVKMLFPLVFMVLPAFLLLTVVPVLIATIRSL